MSDKSREVELDDAAQILAALKAIPPERRMAALAVACAAFCQTDGTLRVD